MKVFFKGERWEHKVNFVDKNNVFVGYDMHQDCCEDADWFISDKEDEKIYDDNYNKIKREIYSEDALDNYVFDTSYIEEINSEQLDEGGMVRFKLISDNNVPLYLHIFNSHNGYYGHGFEFKIGEKVIKEGTL